MARRSLRRRLRARWLTARGRREDAIVDLARTVPGFFHREEIRLLYRSVAGLDGPGDIAEIGSWKGRSTVIMGLALADTGQLRRVYAIDPHVGSEEHRETIAREGPTFAEFEANVRSHGVEDRIEPLVMYSTDAAKELEKRGVELAMAFIDGAHDEENVRADIRGFLPLVRPGGIIALHDLIDSGYPGVLAAYESDLAQHVDEVARAKSLLVTRVRAAPA